MHVVWCSWKDRNHPQAGGAEVVTDHLLKRMVADGHEVTLLTADYPGASPRTDGVKVLRGGGRLTVYWHAWRNYRRHVQGKADLVVDEMNTIPFFASRYAGVPSLLMVHQLCREIWFYQMPWIIGWVGYLVEPIYLFLLRKQPVAAVSESTKQDLLRYGFDGQRIHVISEGVEMESVKSLRAVEKYQQPTLLSLGAMRAMKRTIDQIKAFEIAKKDMPDLRLKIAGDSNDPYGQKVLRYIMHSPHHNSIEYLGRVSAEERLELMQKSHAIAVTSVKEGWGLIVSEAASQGTPAVVYDVDGLRDSVHDGVTGVIAERNTPAGLASALRQLLADQKAYENFREAGWRTAKSLTFDQCYRDFMLATKEVL